MKNHRVSLCIADEVLRVEEQNATFLSGTTPLSSVINEAVGLAGRGAISKLNDISSYLGENVVGIQKTNLHM